MGDSGEGLIDAEGRLQERMEELAANRERVRKAPAAHPKSKEIESLKLARLEVIRQLANTAHPARKAQLSAALADLDRRIAEAQGVTR